MAYGCLKGNVYPDAQIEAEKLNLIINELR